MVVEFYGYDDHINSAIIQGMIPRVYGSWIIDSKFRRGFIMG